MTIRSRIPALLALALLAAGCSSAGARYSARPQRDADLISTEELRAATSYSDAYAIVRVLRPHWLRARRTSLTQDAEVAQVYVDGVRLGVVDVLRDIPLNTVSFIEYLDGISATQRFGTDHGGGAILVTTLRGD
jgi:hypothetical protein